MRKQIKHFTMPVALVLLTQISVACADTSEPVVTTSSSSQQSSSQNLRITQVSPEEQNRIYGPTTDEETLWSIAKYNRPNHQVSIHQTVLAIYHLNPQAFEDHNIHGLIPGSTLRLPRLEQVQKESTAEAKRIIELHAKRPIPSKVDPSVAPPQPVLVGDSSLPPAVQTQDDMQIKETQQVSDLEQQSTQLSEQQQETLQPIEPTLTQPQNSAQTVTTESSTLSESESDASQVNKSDNTAQGETLIATGKEKLQQHPWLWLVVIILPILLLLILLRHLFGRHKSSVVSETETSSEHSAHIAHNNDSLFNYHPEQPVIPQSHSELAETAEQQSELFNPLPEIQAEQQLLDEQADEVAGASLQQDDPLLQEEQDIIVASELEQQLVEQETPQVEALLAVTDSEASEVENTDVVAADVADEHIDHENIATLEDYVVDDVYDNGRQAEGEQADEFESDNLPAEFEKNDIQPAQSEPDTQQSAESPVEVQQAKQFVSIDELLNEQGEQTDLDDEVDLDFGLDEFPDVIGDVGEIDVDLNSELNSKLDLAKFFIEMGDFATATKLLQDVLATGDEELMAEAQRLIDKTL